MMFGSLYHLLFLFLFWFMPFQAVLSSSSSSSFNLSYPPPAKKLCSPEQSFALLHFNNSLSVDEDLCDYPKTNAWKENRDCCSWDGVTCDTFTGHVIGLDLSSSCLSGTIHDNSSLFLLHHLQKLNLADNSFDGSHFSSKFVEFRELTHLNLSLTNFGGLIPVEISHLSKLVSLDLSHTHSYKFVVVVGLELSQESFSKMLQNLTELRYLHLDSVNLSSVAPGSLVNLSSSLISLSLEYSGLQGRFPNDVFHLPFLQRLCLSANYLLTGNLPNSNWSVPLELLDLSHTSFSGEIPETIGSLKYLNVLDFSSTSFSGELPETIGSLKYLNVLDLSDCNFKVSIPASFWNLTRIISLDLSYSDFTGQIPTSISNIGELTSLELGGNTFSGQLPDVFGNLSKLTLLSLSRNNFSGQLPSSVFNLTQLDQLCFNDNQFTGHIPYEVSGLSNLTEMDLSDNFLSGRIPFWLFTLPFVWSIQLQNNRLAGPIPSSKFGLVELYELNLSSNNLSGIWEPDNFSMLQNLQLLDLSHNSQLSFTTNFSLPNLWDFYCSSCNFTDFPIFLRSTEALMRLDLSHNSQLSLIANFSLPDLLEFHCSSCNLIDFPIFLRNTKDLQVLDLSNNKISGQISLLKLRFWPSLHYLDLSSNHLTSFEETPPKIEYPEGQLSSLPTSVAFFSVSNNKLSGQIPSLFCNLSDIGHLVLSNNGLSGTIPPCLGKNNQLSHLDLRMNNLQGNIPQSLAMSHIEYLNLNGNQLEGPLPRSFDNCSSLEVLDVGNNNINDIFPYWLASLPTLQVLVLRSNRFHGPIGFSNATFSFSELRILDLSNNLFNGHLPTRYFDSFKAMMQSLSNIDPMAYMGDEPSTPVSPENSIMIIRGQREITFTTKYYSMTLVIKGVQREIDRVLTTLTVLDLSDNLFEGGIPKVLGKLNSLKALNFSHNKFTGHIPSSLENLTELESLDLSSNKLIGEIPKELTSLTYLSVLNLSYNQLVGPIPGGKQFDTFQNDSFEGNLELCGLPLSKKCGFEWVPPTFDEEDNTSSWFDWKVAMMGYGCGLVIGLSMGYIVFAIRKPQWLVRIVERKQLTKAGRFSGRFRGIRNW